MKQRRLTWYDETETHDEVKQITAAQLIDALLKIPATKRKQYQVVGVTSVTINKEEREVVLNEGK